MASLGMWGLAVYHTAGQRAKGGLLLPGRLGGLAGAGGLRLGGRGRLGGRTGGAALEEVRRRPLLTGLAEAPAAQPLLQGARHLVGAKAELLADLLRPQSLRAALEQLRDAVHDGRDVRERAAREPPSVRPSSARVAGRMRPAGRQTGARRAGASRGARRRAATHARLGAQIVERGRTDGVEHAGRERGRELVELLAERRCHWTGIDRRRESGQRVSV